MARGVRGEKSKLAGGIELFAICDVVLGEGKGELGVLTSARLTQFYKHIMTDYDRLQFAYNAIKLISSASEMVDGPEWYDVLAETLAALDTITIPLQLIQTWFYLHHSTVIGYELSLWHDIDGGRLLEGQNYRYEVSDRGLIKSDNGVLTTEHIKLLRVISTRSLKVIIQIGGIADIINDCLLVAREHAAI